MKKTFDKYGRTLYKFSHSVAQGGWVYIHKAVTGELIKNKEGLRNVLKAVSTKCKLIDATIKIYDASFFFFFLEPKSIAPAKIIEAIHKNISSFANWDSEYTFTGVYDLQEKYIRKDLEEYGLDYDKG